MRSAKRSQFEESRLSAVQDNECGKAYSGRAFGFEHPGTQRGAIPRHFVAQSGSPNGYRLEVQRRIAFSVSCFFFFLLSLRHNLRSRRFNFSRSCHRRLLSRACTNAMWEL